MASIVPDPKSTRPPAFGERVVYSTWKGKPRVQRWPKKRGLPTDPYQLQSLGRFAMTQYIAKHTDPSLIIEAMTATKKTGLYPRDLLTKAVMGGFFEPVLPDGRKLTRPPKLFEVPVFVGATVYLNANVPLGANVNTLIPWDLAELNPFGLWDPTEPEAFVIPPAVSVVRLDAQIFAASAGSYILTANINQNALENAVALQSYNGSGFHRFTLTSGPVACAPGDRFRVHILSSIGNSLNAGRTQNRFSITVLG